MIGAASWSWEYALQILPTLLEALWLTSVITASASAIAGVLGLLWALANRSRHRAVRAPGRCVMNFVRGTPTLVQAFVVYYVLPDYGILLSATLTGVIVLGVHYAAYSAEVYRSGIDAVPRGQWEAAKALGLTPARTMARIVLPPAVRTSVPPLVNLVIAMYKETAVLFVIGIPILLYVGQTEANQSFRYLESYTLVGVLYLLVSYPSVLILRRFEASND